MMASRRFWLGILACLLVSLGLTTTQAEPGDAPEKPGRDAAAATLKMRFVYGGDAPQHVQPQVVQGGGGNIVISDESLLVHRQNRGIKNVVTFVYTGRGGTKLPPNKSPKRYRPMAILGHRFVPHILTAVAGDDLGVVNLDAIRSDVNFNFFNNPPMALILRPGQRLTLPIALPGPAPIPIDSNLHPWKRSYVVILDHPFIGVSDEDGNLEITGLPANQELVFRAWHEHGSINQVELADGTMQPWRRSRFSLDMKPGTTDLGDLRVPVAAFQLP